MYNAYILIFIVEKLPRKKLQQKWFATAAACSSAHVPAAALSPLLSSYFNYQLTITHYFLVLLENIFIKY